MDFDFEDFSDETLEHERVSQIPDLEDASKTLVGTYRKDEMSSQAFENTRKKLEDMEDVEVEHLPNVGGFILTFKNDTHRIDRTDDISNLGINWVVNRVMHLDVPKNNHVQDYKDEKSSSKPRISEPNDPEFVRQEQAYATIKMLQGWNEYKKHKAKNDVVVAVLDSGIRYNHEDLKNMVWKNPNEVFNGIDDDGNGIIDDVYGVDFTYENSPGDPLDIFAPIYHGTKVAGIIGAQGNNNKGIIGVAGDTKGRVRHFQNVYTDHTYLNKCVTRLRSWQ